MEEQNYDPYAELNSLISKEDAEQSSDRRNPKKAKREKSNKNIPKKGKPKKDNPKKEKRKGPIRWVLLILLLLCLALGAIYFLKPKPIMRQIDRMEKIIQKTEKKTEKKTVTKPKKSSSQSNNKNVSNSDTKSKTKSSKSKSNEKNSVSNSDTKTDKPEKIQPQQSVNDGFSYQDGAVKVVLCGNSFEFPFAPNAVADKGWNGISVNADPDNASLSVSTWTNVDGSTLYLYYPSNMNGAMVTKAECSFVGTASSFLGLSMEKSTTDCDFLFSDAGRKDISGLDANGNGKEIFYYDTCQIAVSFQNGFVTSCSIEKI